MLVRTQEQFTVADSGRCTKLFCLFGDSIDGQLFKFFACSEDIGLAVSGNEVNLAVR
jgi:hypothetical protein